MSYSVISTRRRLLPLLAAALSLHVDRVLAKPLRESCEALAPLCRRGAD